MWMPLCDPFVRGRFFDCRKAAPHKKKQSTTQSVELTDDVFVIVFFFRFFFFVLKKNKTNKEDGGVCLCVRILAYHVLRSTSHFLGWAR